MTINFISADWPAPKNIVAGTTTRSGGFSIEPYDSFNLASHVGDNIHHVQKNRQLLVTELDLPHEPKWLNQVHGTKVVDFTELENNANSQCCADAVISFESNIVCAVLTADCLPLLITDTIGSCVAAIHAGWRGLRYGIIEQTIASLNRHPDTLIVWIGPAISAAVFEVDNSVRDGFVAIDINAEKAYSTSRPGHWMMDLVLLAKQRLINNGIDLQSIYGGCYCSFTDNKSFYSYRRSSETGRMVSLIYNRKSS
ncbi:FIG00003370: Multicopper polyphenol oxidase [hydrothermal vent metagenome]|uniref:FIG00003370: Multicopper polyphenol oxidase n=1 Tax=hydrothermal vent metagenome TaxID=652676 RepID=A0A3B1A4K0_9ZZZZ